MILRIFGKQGDHVVHGLNKAAELFYGPKIAKTLKADIFKLVLKMALMHQNKVITEADAAPARPLVLSMIDLVLETLDAPHPGRRALRPDVTTAMKKTHDAVVPLVSGARAVAGRRRSRTCRWHVPSPLKLFFRARRRRFRSTCATRT